MIFFFAGAFVDMISRRLYNENMIYETHNYNADAEFPAILRPYFEGQSVGVFDIETTGLSGEYGAFILGGLGTADMDFNGGADGDSARSDGGNRSLLPEGRMKVEQFFAETRDEEEHALDRCLAALSSLDAIVTYNGAGFDMPFLHCRATKYGLDAMYDMPHNLDLFRIIKRFSALRRILPNFRQKTVENYFGLWGRSDEITGKESIELYGRWERRGDREALQKILLHNREDVEQLTRLLPIVKKADVHRAMTNIGFPAGPLSVTGLKYIGSGRCTGTGGALQISGIQRRNPFSYYAYAGEGQDYEAAFDEMSKAFSVTVPLRRAAQLLVLDLDRLLPDHEEFLDSPYCESGFLIVRQDERWQYGEMNRFCFAFLKKILEGTRA